MERPETSSRKIAPQGRVNLRDLRFSASRTRTNFTRIRGGTHVAKHASGPQADFITFVSLACEIYQRQDHDLVPIQQYPPALETYQGKGHTSLVSHAKVVQQTPSGFVKGSLTSHDEGIILKRPRHIREEKAKSDALLSFITDLRIRSHRSLAAHPNITRLRGVGWDFEDDEATIPRPILLEEFAPQGALDNFWKNWSFVRLSFKANLEFCRDIAEGLRALHACGVVHGDLKPENILVFPRKDARESFMVKLTDFGHSALMSDDPETLPAFTPWWCAPEATTATNMTFTELKLTDYYSYGLVILSITLGRAFHVDFDDVEKSKQDGTILVKAAQLLEKEDKNNYESDIDVGAITSMLRKTIQLNPVHRNLDACVALIERQVIHPHRSMTIGYHTLSQCSHQLKEFITEKLLVIARNPRDPRRAAAEWELMICYFSGFGVKQNFEMASLWLDSARENNIEAAETYYKTLRQAIELGRKSASGAKLPPNKDPGIDKPTVERVLSGSLQVQTVQEESERDSRSATTMATTAVDSFQVDSERFHVTGVLDDVPFSPLNPMPANISQAVSCGDIDALKSLTGGNPSMINSQDSEGNTPLIIAAKYRQYEVMDFLLNEPRTDASTPNRMGQTVLHIMATFDESQIRHFLPLLSPVVDLNQESLPVWQDSERTIFSLGLRCCPILNSILHRNIALLDALLDIAHVDKAASICRICELGSRFRRVLAISLALFYADALEAIMAHLKKHKAGYDLDLRNINVWTGQDLLPLCKVPFHNVAIAALDLPENFFRAMIFGDKYADALHRTMRFLLDMDQSKKDSLALTMLCAAIEGGSLDAVDFLLTDSKKWAKDPLWWLLHRSGEETWPELSSPTIKLAVSLGQREIFDRLSRENVAAWKDWTSINCSSPQCWVGNTKWEKAVMTFFGPHALFGTRAPNHEHVYNLVRPALEYAVSARHQDHYFLSRIIQMSNPYLIKKGSPGFLIDSLSNSYFRATDLLIQRCPELWELRCFEYARMKQVLSGFEYASPTDSRSMLRFELRMKFPELPKGETVAELVLFTEGYTQYLWSVIEAQVGNGHSKSASYLTLALKWSNTTALRVMLEIGWHPEGPLLSRWFYSPFLLLSTLEMKARKANPYLTLSPALIQDQELSDAPPLLRGPALETHKGLYSRYNRNRLDQFRSMYIKRLQESRNILTSHGARTSLVQNVSNWLSSPASWRRRAYVDMVRVYGRIFYGIFYAAIAPLALVFGTRQVWTTLPLGGKFGFAYLWAGLAAGTGIYTTNIFPSRYERKYQVAAAITLVLFFIANNVVLPVLIVRLNIRPFLSCTHFVDDGQLVSTCTNYSYLLPLAVGVVEVAWWCALIVASA
ncbi:hypothetical protein jhhlp_005476 [Lomentospora prolificans]|uniref:Protein kinase domain-containing protein n=1 Tax=Lomentospora prolificans TaxID=41688 RepID=A0A2N3N6X2_9PEZI|nr:hypothetical protein jhhlp_005476 [Lomentospora prolificans]